MAEPVATWTPPRTSNPLIRALRWIAALPVALLLAALANVVVVFGNRLTMSATGFDPDAPLNAFFIAVVAGASFGAASVYVSTRIAPSHRKIVAIVVAALMVFSSGMLALVVIGRRDWLGLASLIAGSVAAISLCLNVHAGTVDVGGDA